MPPHRKLLLSVCILLGGGSLAWTAGYGLYLRSDGYRAGVIEDLVKFFEMPCDVARIRPSTFSSRVFEDVRVWLPNRRDQVFRCRRAVWHEGKVDGRESNHLELVDGILNLGTDRWQLSDYRQVFQSGLGHDFEDLNLDEISLRDFEMGFVRGTVAIRCRDTSGILEMKSPTDGVARLVAYELNGYRIEQGVQIDARFTPKMGINVSQVHLRLPHVPLATLDLSRSLGAEITTGQFAGSIEYRGMQDDPEAIVQGDLIDADLAQLTARLPIGPLTGRVRARLEHGRITHSVLTHLRGEGEVAGLTLAPFAVLVGQQTLAGEARFNLHVIDLALGHVRRLVFDGEVRGASLAQWLNLWGRGAATGELTVQVHSLRVADDRIEWGDIEINAVPAPGQRGTIDRGLLLELAEKAGGLSIPDFLRNQLPEKISYARLGLRLQIRNNQLRILGTHGDKGDTILTIELFGRPIGVLSSLSATINLEPWLQLALDRLRAYDPQRMREWWRGNKD